MDTCTIKTKNDTQQRISVNLVCQQSHKVTLSDYSCSGRCYVLYRSCLLTCVWGMTHLLKDLEDPVVVMEIDAPRTPCSMWHMHLQPQCFAAASPQQCTVLSKQIIKQHRLPKVQPLNRTRPTSTLILVFFYIFYSLLQTPLSRIWAKRKTRRVRSHNMSRVLYVVCEKHWNMPFTFAVFSLRSWLKSHFKHESRHFPIGRHDVHLHFRKVLELHLQSGNSSSLGAMYRVACFHNSKYFLKCQKQDHCNMLPIDQRNFGASEWFTVLIWNQPKGGVIPFHLMTTRHVLAPGAFLCTVAIDAGQAQNLRIYPFG